MVCMNHPDVEAERHCLSCFKPYCEECLTDYDGMVFCSKRCHILHTDGVKKTEADRVRARQKSRKKLVKRLVVLVIIAAGVFLGWTFLPDAQKEKVETLFNNAIEGIKNRGD